ncbi:MAG: phosphoribosyltransferase family protein [Eubacteriales bacterium]|nr:phosphoribosyltransferase family protein [Eubacteriales bacterium]
MAESDGFKDLLYSRGVIKKGHFLRLSGRHADYYIQCARLFEDADTGRRVGEALAALCGEWGAQLVLSAAVGGILPGYETARALNLPHLYCEKRDGVLTLRRDFVIPEGSRVLLVEDEVYTGQSIMEMREIVRALGARVAGTVCIVDKSMGQAPVPPPFAALHAIPVRSFQPASCPLCGAGETLVNQ